MSVPLNGHSGISALQVFEEFFQGKLKSSRSREALISEGRTKLAKALRSYRYELCNLYGFFYYGKEVLKLIGKRASMHDKVKNSADPCDCCAWVKGPLDLHAWSMEVRRNVCVVTHGMRDVLIYSKDASVRLVPLHAFQPGFDDIVLLLKDNHFASLVLKTNARIVKSKFETLKVSKCPEMMPFLLDKGGGDAELDDEKKKKARRLEQQRLYQQRRRLQRRLDDTARAEHLEGDRRRKQRHREKQKADDTARAEHLEGDRSANKITATSRRLTILRTLNIWQAIGRVSANRMVKAIGRGSENRMVRPRVPGKILLARRKGQRALMRKQRT